MAPEAQVRAAGREHRHLGPSLLGGKGSRGPRSWPRKAVSGRFWDVECEAHKGQEDQILNQECPEPLLFQDTIHAPNSPWVRRGLEKGPGMVGCAGGRGSR